MAMAHVHFFLMLFHLSWFCTRLAIFASFHQLTSLLVRFGTRLHFELKVITKVDTINDNVVTTGRTISKQSPCA